jgi:hypothetical protein
LAGVRHNKKARKPRHLRDLRAGSEIGTLWRRGELNPRPETPQMAASTCLVGFLISMLTTKIDTLHQHPAI